MARKSKRRAPTIREAVLLVIGREPVHSHEIGKRMIDLWDEVGG